MSEKKAAIMKVATDLLMTNSYAKVNMSTIADACGITKAGIYYHFKNKEELIGECLRTTLADVNKVVYTHSARSVTVREKLKEICGDLYKVAKQTPGILTLFMRSISEPEMRDLLESLGDQVEMFLREMGEIIRYGFGTGEVRESIDPFNASRMLVGTLMLQLQSRTLLRKNEELNTDDVVDLLFDGIGA
ncbi:MAG TPA: TetR/AcrR family transcriptional regulator [Candidatus Sabulitectum sp.]|nr:TetR/AcrR family transcriptional regulator [Candidatus Sabulitectum sp.]